MSRFDEIREKFLEEAKGRTDSRSIYELRKKYLDRKAGEVNALMKEMRSIPKEEKAEFGKNVNILKDWVLENLTKMEEKAREAELQHRYEKEKIDVTIPAKKKARQHSSRRMLRKRRLPKVPQILPGRAQITHNDRLTETRYKQEAV